MVTLRKEAKITQADLAEKIGISRAALSLYEIEKREPDFETIEKIADFFEVSTDYLFGRTEIKSPNLESERRYLAVASRLGTILKKYRDDFNLSEQTVAKKLDITTETYIGIEIGNYSPSLQLLQKISKLTTYDIDYLTGAIDSVIIP